MQSWGVTVEFKLMSNLVPEPKEPSDLTSTDKSEILSDFLIRLNDNLLNVTATNEQKEILETMEKAFELRKKASSLKFDEMLQEVEREKMLKIAILSSELEIVAAQNKIRNELELKDIEIDQKKQSAQLEILEAKYKVSSLRTKQILGFASIPLFIGFGAYLYLYSNNFSLGVTMIVLGLGGALLNSFQDIIKLLGLLNPKDNQ